jgi:CheY-like chemotaxis protein
MSDKVKILWIDDDYTSNEYMKEYLVETLGFDVLVSAQEDILERLSHEAFDLLIIDVMIRSKSVHAPTGEARNIHYDNVHWSATGLEFLNRLRQGCYAGPGGTPPNVPAIVLSAVAESQAWPEKEPTPVTIYIEKAGDPQEFINTICRCLPNKPDACHSA